MGGGGKRGLPRGPILALGHLQQLSRSLSPKSWSEIIAGNGVARLAEGVLATPLP
jgi:hypothetical protein